MRTASERLAFDNGIAKTANRTSCLCTISSVMVGTSLLYTFEENAFRTEQNEIKEIGYERVCNPSVV